MDPSNGIRIRRLRLTNYRSVALCDLAFGDLVVLVGPNGSGKSNIVDALLFVREAITGGLADAVESRGGGQIVFQGSSRSSHPAVSVRLDVDGLTGGRSCEYELSFTGGSDNLHLHSEEACAVRSRDGDIVARFDSKLRYAEVGALAFPLPAPHEPSSLLAVLSGYEPFSAARRALTSISASSPDADAMRSIGIHQSRAVLWQDAANIASVLARLQSLDPALKERIDEYLRLIVPGIASTVVRRVEDWEVLEFEQEPVKGDRNRSFSAAVMSDGTLRALGVLTALFPSEINGASWPVCIEEPETALHPAAAGVLLDAVHDASERRQVFVITHSPDLLDGGVAPSELFAVRATGNGTRVGPLDGAGRVALGESGVSAGDLLRTDRLRPAHQDGDLRWQGAGPTR